MSPYECDTGVLTFYLDFEIDIKPEAAGYQLPLDMNDIVNVDKIKIIVDYNTWPFLLHCQ